MRFFVDGDDEAHDDAVRAAGNSYRVAVVLADSTRDVAVAAAGHGYTHAVKGLGGADKARQNAVDQAVRNFTVAESNAYATKLVDLADAEADYRTDDAASFAVAMADLAIDDPSPWANLAADVAAAKADLAADVAAAEAEKAAGEANANRDLEVAEANAELVKSNLKALATAIFNDAAADARLVLAEAEAAAKVLAAALGVFGPDAPGPLPSAGQQGEPSLHQKPGVVTEGSYHQSPSAFSQQGCSADIHTWHPYDHYYQEYEEVDPFEHWHDESGTFHDYMQTDDVLAPPPLDTLSTGGAYYHGVPTPAPQGQSSVPPRPLAEYGYVTEEVTIVIVVIVEGEDDPAAESSPLNECSIQAAPEPGSVAAQLTDYHESHPSWDELRRRWYEDPQLRNEMRARGGTFYPWFCPPPPREDVQGAFLFFELIPGPQAIPAAAFNAAISAYYHDWEGVASHGTVVVCYVGAEWLAARAALGANVRVFRVEGTPNTRIIIAQGGEVIIEGERTLFLNFGNRARAEAFLALRFSQGMPGVTLKSFEVPASFLNELRASAVLENDVWRFPNNPVRVDVTKAPDQFGLRADQIRVLRVRIVAGSGEIKP